MKETGALWWWKKRCRREVFLWMAFQPVSLAVYMVFWKSLLDLCRYGGVSKRLPIVAGSIALALVWAVVYLVRLGKYHRCGIPIVFDEARVDGDKIYLKRNDFQVELLLKEIGHYRFTKKELYLSAGGNRFFVVRPGADTGYLKLKLSVCGFRRGTRWLLPCLCLVIAVTAAGILGVVKSAGHSGGRLGYYLSALKDTRWAEIKRDNIYTDGLDGVLEAVESKVNLPKYLCLAGTFNLHFNREGKIISLDTFLYGFDEDKNFTGSYLLSLKEGESLRIDLHGAATGIYDDSRDFNRLAEGIRAIPLEERADKWQQDELGVLYRGVRTWQTTDDNVIFVNSGREMIEMNEVTDHGEEASGYSISVFVPEQADGNSVSGTESGQAETAPYRYLYVNQEEWDLLSSKKLEREQQAALARKREPVVFADKTIEELVKHELGIYSFEDRPVTVDELGQVRMLGVYHGESISNDYYRDWENKKVGTLEDLSKLKNLQVLCLNRMEIEDLSIFREAELSGLRSLYLRGNRIQNVESLSFLTDLEVLDLSHNSISDITPFSGMDNLRALYIDGNMVKEISSIGNLSLEELRAGGNMIEDISPLGSMESLKAVYLDNNPFPSRQRAEYLDSRENRIKVVEKRERIGKGLGEFSFQAVLNTGENTEGVIQYVVTEVDSGRILGELFTQERTLLGGYADILTSEENGEACDMQKQMSLKDVDFDGYLDLVAVDTIRNRVPAYFYLRWVPEEGRFQEDTDLRLLDNPVFDSKRRMVITEYNDGRNSFTKGYQYLDGKLSLVFSRYSQDLAISEEALWKIPQLAEQMEAALKSSGLDKEDALFRVQYYEEKERGDVFSNWDIKKNEYQLLLKTGESGEEQTVVTFGSDSLLGEAVKNWTGNGISIDSYLNTTGLLP